MSSRLNFNGGAPFSKLDFQDEPYFIKVFLDWHDTKGVDNCETAIAARGFCMVELTTPLSVPEAYSDILHNTWINMDRIGELLGHSRWGVYCNGAYGVSPIW